MLDSKGFAKWLALLFFSLFIIVGNSFIKPMYAYNVIPKAPAKTYANDAFRDVTVSGTKGSYQINGQVSADYSKYGYSLDEGHVEYTKKWVSVNKNQNQGAWIPFQITINITKEQLPYSGMLNLLLFVDDQDQDALYIPVEYFYPN